MRERGTKLLVPPQIFTGNDLMAFGVLQAARELNLPCPEDLSIASFDSLEFAKFTEPSLTSVISPDISWEQPPADSYCREWMARLDRKRSFSRLNWRSAILLDRPMTPVRMAPHDLQLRAYAASK
jgi:Periplasmic binding protein-like domain